MLVNSFDTKYSKTAAKYEILDDNFTSILKKKKNFTRIFTSVLENKELNLSSDILLRSDITGQIINTVLAHDHSSTHHLYYMGDIFKKDLLNNQIKQFRQHGVEIINCPKFESFGEVIKILDKILTKLFKKECTFIFTDPRIQNKNTYLLNSKSKKSNIVKFINIFKKSSKYSHELNLDKNFFSQDYHQDIFFYVYSNISKKILAQGGGYHYIHNRKRIDGFGFSCNIDNFAELI